MGKIKRSYKEVDRSGEGQYAGEVPKPGMYDAKLVRVSDHTSGAGNDGLEWVFEITEEPYAGWRGWVYTNDEASAWKEVQVLEAIGALGKDEDNLSTTHESLAKNANGVRIKVSNETYEGEKRGKIRTVLPMPGSEPGGKKKKSKKKDKVEKDDSPF